MSIMEQQNIYSCLFFSDNHGDFVLIFFWTLPNDRLHLMATRAAEKCVFKIQRGNRGDNTEGKKENRGGVMPEA